MTSLSKVLHGIAVGDAIGNPLEFLASVTPADVEAIMLADSTLRISDDTQMTLFCAEALAFSGGDVRSVPSALHFGYRGWHTTQRTTKATQQHGLLSFPEMFSREAPGLTCISSCQSMEAGFPVINNSKGNGTVMRCAPFAFWGRLNDLHDNEIIKASMMDASLTHKHSHAAESSALLTSIYLHLLDDYKFNVAVASACRKMRGVVSAEIIQLVMGSLDPATHKARCTYHGTLHSGGARTHSGKGLGGWVAEEALALAVGAVNCSSTYRQAITSAVAIGGDSDTVGGIAGGLAAASGMKVPKPLKNRLNALRPIDYVVSLWH